MQRFAGPAHLVAADLLWGPNRIWPRDKASEHTLPWQTAEGGHIGILGAGLGAWGCTVKQLAPTANITEFDWRSDVARWRIEREPNQEVAVDGITFHEINPGALLPPPARCNCILGVEPIFVQTGSSMLNWARLALASGGTMVLEEIAIDNASMVEREAQSRMMVRTSDGAQWLRLDEQKGMIRRNGFLLGKVRERTGAHLRALQQTMDLAMQRLEPLNEAIKHAPSLKNVADHFNCELNAAKNRLKALEQGALAVYRIEVIKPRAEELI